LEQGQQNLLPNDFRLSRARFTNVPSHPLMTIRCRSLWASGSLMSELTGRVQY
jgi:hypothetical protein